MDAIRFIAVVVALGMTSAAYAADSAKERAQAAFKEGQSAYEKGEYENALRAFEAAYEAVPAPALFFNIAQCHRKMNDHARAVEALEQFTKQATRVSAKVMKEAKQQLNEERKLLKAEQERAAAAPPPPPPPPEPEPEPAPVAVEPPPAPPPPTTTTEDAPLWQNPIVIGAAVGTVVLAGTAATVAALSLAPGPTPPPTTLGVVDLR